MTTKRAELIKALTIGLKIESDVFAIDTIKEYTEFLTEDKYLDFYQAVMKEDTFGNGVKAVMKVAEQFKPIQKDEITERAKKLILFVETQNTSLGEMAIAEGTDFKNLVLEVKPLKAYERTFEVMDLVAPYYNAKLLIINIRGYQTASDTLNAFKSAIEKSDAGYTGLAIERSNRKLIIPTKSFYDDTPRENRNNV